LPFISELFLNPSEKGNNGHPAMNSITFAFQFAWYDRSLRGQFHTAAEKFRTINRAKLTL